MKLSRAQLASIFKDQLFEIETANLFHQSIRFKDRFVKCILSCSPIDFGFEIFGTYSVRIKYNCDRCTASFDKKVRDSLTLWCLTKIIDLKNKDIEVFYMKNNNDIIDLGLILSDLISLNRPIKILCNNNCKGICICCGTNLNSGVCQKNQIKSYHHSHDF